MTEVSSRPRGFRVQGNPCVSNVGPFLRPLHASLASSPSPPNLLADLFSCPCRRWQLGQEGSLPQHPPALWFLAPTQLVRRHEAPRQESAPALPPSQPQPSPQLLLWPPTPQCPALCWPTSSLVRACF